MATAPLIKASGPPLPRPPLPSLPATLLVAAVAATVGFLTGSVVEATLLHAAPSPAAVHATQPLPLARQLALSATPANPASTVPADSAVEAPLRGAASGQGPLEGGPVAQWTGLVAAVLGVAGLVWGGCRLLAVFPLSGLRGGMEPFLDAIDDDETFQTVEKVTEDMEVAEAAGDEQRLQQLKTVMAAAMMMVSFETVKKAVRTQVACGTITVHSLIDSILVHAVPPLPSADGVVDFTVEDVALGRFWRQPDLWQVAPLLKNLHDCEAELQVDLGDVLMGLLQRYTGCVSYVSLENPSDGMLTPVEHETLRYLAKACFDINVPYKA
eukprot:EG_transcript_17843